MQQNQLMKNEKNAKNSNKILFLHSNPSCQCWNSWTRQSASNYFKDFERMFENFHLIWYFSQCGVFQGDPCNKWNSISWNNVVLLPLSVPLWTLPRRPWVLISLSLRRMLKFKVFQTHCDVIILTDRKWFSCALMAPNFICFREGFKKKLCKITHLGG